MLVSSFLLIKSTLNCKDGKQNFYLKQVEQPSFHQFYNPSLFILSCFRMPESICNKMDSIVRAFGGDTSLENINFILSNGINSVSQREMVA